MQKEIKQTWYFNQPPQEIWEYLTNPVLIEQWLMKSDFMPIVGHKFRFTYTPKEGSKYAGIVNCEVLEVKPFAKLSYSWDGAIRDGDRTFNSKVVWKLIPKEKGTELHLQHNGFSILEDILNHSSGWDNCLKRFKEIINNNKK